MTLPAIQKSIHIEAPPETVFQALTDPARIVEFFPLTSVELDGREGGQVRYHGIAGGEPFTDHGIIEVFSPPSRYRYAYWSDNHGTERDRHVTIDYRLAAVGPGTRLTVLQDNLPSPELHRLMDEQVWDELLGSLKRYLEAAPTAQ